MSFRMRQGRASFSVGPRGPRMSYRLGCLLPGVMFAIAVAAAACGPGPGAQPAAPRPTTVAPAFVPAQTTKPAPASVYYANCTDARAAGATPLRRGQPGYRAALDRDNDGIACE